MNRTKRLVSTAAALFLLTNTVACGAAAPKSASPANDMSVAPPPSHAELAEPSSGGAAPAPAPARPGGPSPVSPTPAGAAAAKTTAAPQRAPGASKAKDASEARSQLVVYTGALSMTTEPDKVPQTIDKIIDVAEALGGSLMGRRDDGVDIRVPSQHFRAALKELEGVAVVTTRSVKAEDVTEQVHDLEVRLSNLKATQKRLQEFLARAANVNDALTVERELERVAQEIDTIEGKVTFLKTRASFSQISVALRERPRETPLVKGPPATPPAARTPDSPRPLARRPRHRSAARPQEELIRSPL